MSRAKQITLEAVRSLPETSTMDDVLDKVYLVAQILEGLVDAEAGRLLTTDQLLKKDDWDV